MIYVLINNEAAYTTEEKQAMAERVREKLRPVQDQFPEADMTAIWVDEENFQINSSHPQLVSFALNYLKPK